MNVNVSSAETADKKTILGSHVIAGFFGCTNISDPVLVEHILIDAAKAARATVLSSHMHDFGEHMGVTGVVILAESHISIHSWPEHGYAAIDIFMCGSADPYLAIEKLKQEFLPERVEIDDLKRGVLAI